MKARFKINGWLVVAVGAVILAVGGVVMSLDPQVYTPARNLAAVPPLECLKDGDRVLAFAAQAPADLVLRFAALKNLTALTFESVRIDNGEIRLMTGGFAEGDRPRSSGGSPYDSARGGFNNGPERYGTYGSYGSYAPDLTDDPGVGLARLRGGGRFEIRAQAGRVTKFRGSPLRMELVYFNGKWERPGDDPAFTDHVNAMLGVANLLMEQCRTQ